MIFLSLIQVRIFLLISHHYFYYYCIFNSFIIAFYSINQQIAKLVPTEVSSYSAQSLNKWEQINNQLVNRQQQSFQEKFLIFCGLS